MSIRIGTTTSRLGWKASQASRRLAAAGAGVVLAASVSLATALPSAASAGVPTLSTVTSQASPIDVRPDRHGPIITVAPVGSAIAATGVRAAALGMRRTAPAPTIETLEKLAAAARAVATKRANEAAAAAKAAATLTKQANDAARAATTITRCRTKTNGLNFLFNRTTG